MKEFDTWNPTDTVKLWLEYNGIIYTDELHEHEPIKEGDSYRELGGIYFLNFTVKGGSDIAITSFTKGNIDPTGFAVIDIYGPHGYMIMNTFTRHLTTPQEHGDWAFNVLSDYINPPPDGI